MKLFFILGKHPALSFVEILSVFQRLGGRFSVLHISHEACLVDVARRVSVSINTYGGIPKMGHLLDIPYSKEKLISLLQQRSIQGKRLVFGISISRLHDDVTTTELQHHQKEIHALCMDIKRHFLSRGISMRVVTGKTRILSSATTIKSKVFDRGAEVVFFFTPQHQQLGLVDAVQDIHALTVRDVHRPARDTYAGMLPSKLARIMVNIALASQRHAHPTLLDPFCGSGTVLQEAMFLGCNVIGADKSPSAIKDTTENIAWLLQSQHQAHPSSHTIVRSDVRKLTEHLQPQSVDIIVTEPFLGNPARRPYTGAALRSMTQKLSALYEGAFHVFKKVLRPGGRVVIVFPRFVLSQSHRETMSLSDTVLPRLRGWKNSASLPQEYEKQFSHECTPNGAFLYARPDQYVQREIFVFEPLNV